MLDVALLLFLGNVSHGGFEHGMRWWQRLIVFALSGVA
jgi:hypothetical protein